MNRKKIASFAIGPIVGAALSAATLPITTWFYSSEEIGRISMLQVAISVVLLLFTLGLDQAYVREFHETEDKAALLKVAVLPGLVLLSVLLAVALFWPNAVSKAVFGVESFLISVLVAICLLAAFLSRFLSLILRMEERGLAFSMSQMLPKLLYLLIIGGYALFAFGFDLLHLVIAQTASIVMVTVVYAWNTSAHWGAALRQAIDKQRLKNMLAFGAPLIVGGLAMWGLTSTDRLFLRNFSTFDELGVYSVAASFASAALLVQSVFSTIWAPTVYKWGAEGVNPEKIDAVIEQVLFVAVFLFALAGVFSWVVTYFVPPKYNSIQYILVSCMAYPLFYTLSETTGVGLGVVRRSFLAMAASIIALLFNLLGCYLLVPKLGAGGAAVSTATSFWIFFFCRTEFSIRVWRPFPRLKLYLSTLLCLVLAVAFTLFGPSHGWLFSVLWPSLLLMTFLKRVMTSPSSPVATKRIVN